MKWIVFFLLIIFCYTLATTQNVGVGTLSPLAKLHIQDGGILVDGDLGNAPSGSGARFMWVPSKRAMRAGEVIGNKWSNDSLGLWSVALGYNCVAKNNYAMAFGQETRATAPNATAFGYGSVANGNYATASGFFSKATGSKATSMGSSTTASGDNSLAQGNISVAKGYCAASFGEGSMAQANKSVAFGHHTKAKSYSGMVIGSFNDTTDASGLVSLSPDTRLFQIGNGFADYSRTNAMTVLASGNIGIGTLIPVSRLHIFNGAVLFEGIGGSNPIAGPGIRMNWIPDKRALRAGEVYGNQWNNDSVGVWSASFGNSGLAKGNASLACGEFCRATGYASASFGSHTTATGFASTSFGSYTYTGGSYSTALGSFSKATGDISFATGLHTKSKSYIGSVIGSYNDSTNASNTSNFHPENRLFQIGNGTAEHLRSNAMTVLQNGKIGIGTTMPLSKFHIQDGSFLIEGSSGDVPVSGAGVRLMWIPSLKAFRAGQAEANEWDESSIGAYSFATGFNNTANGNVSTAFGESNIASGIYSTTAGVYNIASGTSSTAFGEYNIASGNTSFTIGSQTKATGNTSSAFGYLTNASGTHSAVFGADNKSKSYGSFVIGTYNDTTNAANPNFINANNRIFQIGNGYSNIARSNAMTVLQNGNIGIGTTTPGFLLNFPSGLGDKISLWGSSGNHYGFGIQPSLLQIHSDAIGSDIAFGYGHSTAFTETMRIRGNGNVGIGVTLPNSILDVGGRMRLRDGPGGPAGIYFNKSDNSSEVGFMGSYGDNNLIGMYGYNGVGWGLVMNTTNGNTGIGTTTPSQKLHVNGNGLFNGTVTASCGVLVCSDIRYKKNIIPLTNALTSIQSINGIYYNWNKEKFTDKEFTDERQIGFSAQELEKIFPEMVKTDANGFKTVDYSRLTPVLVEAIKEQQVQIEELSKQVEWLTRCVRPKTKDQRPR